MNTQTQQETETVKDKRTLYKTAKALISCAHFKAGDFVSVQYVGQGYGGTHWFATNGVTIYPEHHLSDFVL